MYEFQIYQLAYQIRNRDRQHDIATQAWMNQSVQATKGKGKNVKSAYKSFDDFFDVNKVNDGIFKGGNKNKKKGEMSIAERNRLLNEKEKKNEWLMQILI